MTEVTVSSATGTIVFSFDKDRGWRAVAGGREVIVAEKPIAALALLEEDPAEVEAVAMRESSSWSSEFNTLFSIAVDASFRQGNEHWVTRAFHWLSHFAQSGLAWPHRFADSVEAVETNRRYSQQLRHHARRLRGSLRPRDG
jgi:hypothetical protein